MNGNKQEFPMPYALTFTNANVGHVQEHEQNGRINNAPNDNPRNVKTVRDQTGNDSLGVVAFVDDTTSNEEPRIDFHTQ